MKITMLGHAVPPADGVSIGISRYIYGLASELAKRNDVKLIVRDCGRIHEKWIERTYSPGFSWIPYPALASIRMRGERADVFHSDFVTTGAALVWAKKRPCVVSMHDAIPFTYSSKNISVRWYMKCFGAIKKADAVILMSRDARKEALRLTDLEPEKVHAIYNGIDHKVFKPVPGKEHKNIRVGYLGGLDGRKNAELLVNAYRNIAEERDDIELHAAGAGKNLEAFRSMGMKNAFFYGRTELERAPEFYNSLDIFVMPSLQEGFGMMTLEAMSCGVPVIGVRRSSTPEILGRAGILVEPEADKLSRAITKLADSKKLRDRVARSCLERSMDFSWKKCAGDTMKVYGGLK